MELTKKQEEGLKIAIKRYKDGEKYTVIGGYAGTGKSTLVRFIIEALGIEEKNICYASYTGKAAEVLRKKGNKNAITLHKLLYDSVPKPDGTFFRIPKIALGYSLIIVDECSMVPKSIIELLARHNVHLIFLGDPFQLPPINKDEDNHLLSRPHIFLDEIMRQATESEIIRISMDIRENKPLTIFKGEEVQILPAHQLSAGMLTWADQVLVATNATRISMNNQMRQLLGKGPEPENGDKVICLKNYWEINGEKEKDPLINGSIGYLNNLYPSFIKLPYWIERGENLPILVSDFQTEEGEIYKGIDMDTRMISFGERSLSPNAIFKMGKNPKLKNIIPKEFTYGYAITGHKAQGSEWSKVLVIEEKFPFSREEHARWLYTCATRAEDKLVLIRAD